MRVHARLLAAGVVIVGLCGGMSAQAPPPPQQPAGQPPQRPPVIRSGINFVSVDVIVTDRKSGEVVLDMKQDDFEIREDKKPQKVDSFDIVKIDAEFNGGITPKAIRSTYDEESEAKQPNVRLFILLLDDYHVRRGNDLAVKKPLMDFVQTQLAPQDMVAVMYPMTPISGLTFTRSRESLVESIKNFEGRKGNYEPRNEFEEKYAYYPTQTVENIRNDVTLGALKGAAVRLGGMREGRKSIIFVSEGLTSTVPAPLNDPIAAMPGLPGRGGTTRAAPGTDVSNPRAEAQQFFDSVDLTSKMKETFDIVNRNNTSIYAVDPRGLAVFEYDINQGVSTNTDRKDLNQSIDSLHVLADNTDGRAIVNRNDLATGMKQIMRDASGYYLLGYTSTAAPTDGKFHAIDVRVKRPGVDVRARKGYFAYTLEDVARASAPPAPGPPPEISHALNSIAEPASSGHAARFWTGMDQPTDGKPRVTFVWEPLAGAAAARPTDVPARVMLTATAADGRPVFKGPVGVAPQDAPAVPATATGAAGAPLAIPGASVSFTAPPGAVEMRISVENLRGQVIDSTTQTITVPDYAKAPVSFSTPRVYRARTAREMLLVRNNLEAPPTATREFSRGDRLLIRFDAYAPGSARPEVTAKLLNRTGAAMADVPVQTVEGKPFQIDFPLASLAAGEYLIQIEAKGAAGSAQQVIGFKVGS